jgi:molybdopterin-dependent oxidoreductase alpha subunit
VSWLNPKFWASWIPSGLGQVKPHHFLDILKTTWQNKSELPFALRILRHGVCDGCALGTSGMKDWTMDGVHLCMVRLNLLQLNTMHALDTRRLSDVSALRTQNNRELRAMGRLPFPMRRRRGEQGFERISWDEALELVASRVRQAGPRRIAFYLTSRGITNEVYYVAQKVARYLGTNNVDNSARICHAPSTVALKATLGASASTCSYKDWIGSDLIVFFGSDTPNNQPVTTKYLYYAKKQGTKIVVVNPFREPGLDRYWIPSVFESAMFGTKLADEFFHVHTGGDRAFITGVLKALCEEGGVDDAFVAEHTTGFDALREQAASATWETLEKTSGASRQKMQQFASIYRQAKSAVFVWSMGITQHSFGVDNVTAIVNLALARGMVGRKHCGLMPIRGHSGVQGGAEVGAVPNAFPGGRPVDEESAKQLEELWGFPVPTSKGWNAVEMIEAAHAGEVDVLYSLGGNFLETLPEPGWVREALERVPLRVHQDVVVSPAMLVDPADTVLLLPAATRYEQPGGGTETTTERRIIFSPEIRGRRIGEARGEWEILQDLAQRVDPERPHCVDFRDGAAIREEIALAAPLYEGIQNLAHKGDMVQWGGERLCDNWKFPTPDKRAHFKCIQLDHEELPPGSYRVSTRRGKQFNSMLWADRDPLTGARRDEILISTEDRDNLGLRDGDRVRLRSEVGSLEGRIKSAPITPGNLQVHWPEGNAIIQRGRRDPRCGIPDYNAVVEIDVPDRQ